MSAGDRLRFGAALLARLDAIGIELDMTFIESVEDPGDAVAERPLHGGTLRFRVSELPDWAADGTGSRPAQLAIAISWGEHPSGNFICGEYHHDLARSVYEVGSVIQFAACAGTIASNFDD